MKTIIRHIASIQTGVFVKTITEGDVVCLQFKHFDENGQLRLDALHPDLLAESIAEKHLLRTGDVLFAAKGTKNFAVVIEKRDVALVASTSFFVIRLMDGNVLPEYLAWFLNYPSTQTLLKGRAIGTSMASISKAVLEELEIPIPSIEIQNSILHIAKLRNMEKLLMFRIEALREQQIQQQIANAIK